MGLWTFKTNTDVKRDPDFGNVVSHVSNKIYKVVVHPKNDITFEWIFFLILPEDCSEEEMILMAQQACETFLVDGDYYTVCSLTAEDIEEYTNAIPVLLYYTYAPHEFTWIVPPTELKH